MYQFTDSYSTPVFDAVVADAATGTFVASDVRLLPVWVAAAKAATEEGFCPEYDRLAASLGAPNRSDLSQAGLLQRSFTITLTRRVEVTGYVSQEVEVEVEASSPAEAREEYYAGNVEVDWPEWSHYDIENPEEGDDEVEIYRVRTTDM